MDSTVGDKLFKSKSCYLTANGIEAGYRDNVGRIVDDKLNAGKVFDGSYVSTLTSDNSSLHFIAGDLNYGNCDLADMVCCAALYGKRKNILGLRISLFLKLFLVLCDLKRSFMLHFGIESCYKLVLCILLGKTCNSFKICDLCLESCVGLLLQAVKLLALFLESLLLFLKSFKLCIKSFFLLRNSSLESGNLLATLFNVEVRFLLHLENFVLSCENCFFFGCFRILNSVLNDILSLLLSRSKLLFSDHFSNNNAHAGANYKTANETNY